MVTAELSYNPYLLETEIRFNGQRPRINSLVEKFQKGMLQKWISIVPFIFHDEMNGYDFELVFSGTELDFLELKTAFVRAGVDDAQVHLFHKNHLAEREEKLNQAEDLLKWLSENQNDYFDNTAFREENQNMLERADSYIIAEQYRLFSELFTLDMRISAEKDRIDSERAYNQVLDDCTSLQAKILMCRMKGWKKPNLTNDNPERLIERIRSEKKHLVKHQKSKGLNLRILILPLLVVVGIGLFLISSRNGISSRGIEGETSMNLKTVLTDWDIIGYEELKKKLNDSGFTNISLLEKETDTVRKNRLVSKVLVNDKEYATGDCFAKESDPVLIEYYVLHITVGKNAKDYAKDQLYTDVTGELQEKGFTNTSLKRADDIGWLPIHPKAGTVKTISINGSDKFSSGDIFRYDDIVVVVVHTKEDEGFEEIIEKAE